MAWTWVDRLQGITGWQEDLWECDWSETEEALGVELPLDYKELCRRFGPGYFSDRIRILLDRGDEGILSGWQSDLMLCKNGGSSSLWNPYSIYGHSGQKKGLIAWSYTDWGVCHWLADADISSDSWPMLVTGELGPSGSWYRYDISASELIFRVLTDPELKPFSIAGSDVVPEFYRFDPEAAEDIEE